jgi:hypothetical protein
VQRWWWQTASQVHFLKWSNVWVTNSTEGGEVRRSPLTLSMQHWIAMDTYHFREGYA